MLFRELFDQTFHTTRQISRSLGLAMLECIDEIVTGADNARRMRRRVLLVPVSVCVLIACVGVSCAAAYLSVEKPATYQRLLEVPRGVWSRWHPSTTLTDRSHSSTGSLANAFVHAPAPPQPAQPEDASR